jgi:hypothetical protein
MAGEQSFKTIARVVPAIHVLLKKCKAWMPGTRPGMTVLEMVRLV